MFKILMLSLYLIINLRTCKLCESLRAVVAMENLLKTQAHLIKSITKSLKFVGEKERDIVEVYLDKLKKEHALSKKDPEHYLGNPINSYTLITRLYRDLPFVELILNKTKSYKRKKSLVYPTGDDVKGAAEGIIMIQIMYRLKISDLANGTIISRYSKTMEEFVEHVTPMTTTDCIHFSNLYKKDRNHYITWLEEAYRKYSTDHKLCNILESELVAQIGSQYFLMEDWSNSIIWLNKLLVFKPTDKNTTDALRYAKHRFEIDKNKTKKRTAINYPFDSDLIKLCRHESRFIARNASVVCYYAHGPHPFLKLAPIKAEQLHIRPSITMFYDVITDKEIQTFKTQCKPMSPRTVFKNNVQNGYKLVSESGSLIGSMPMYQNCSEVDSVERRMLHYIGMWSYQEFTTIEIANYGIGGSLSAHLDFINEYDKTPVENKLIETLKQRQRIATALFYLSEVEQGGATVFLKANLTVFPVKNAALFWYNLDPWGHGDNDTAHAACPVLRGSKWIATKWFQRIEQDLRIHCPPYAPPYLNSNKPNMLYTNYTNTN